MLVRITAVLLFIMISPILLFFGILILIVDGYPAIFKQDRVGKNEKVFKMYKFRTMKNNTDEISKNDFKNANSQITKIGKFLRKFSIDELLQIVNIIKGNMTFIGYRPGIRSETRLNSLRKEKGVFKYLPGVTGWAQVNGRDSLSIIKKIEHDAYYIQNKGILLNFKIVYRTIIKVILAKDIKE